MAFTIKSFDDILGDMVAWIVANSPSITDMSPGSVIRSYCEGASLGIEEVYVAMYLGFTRALNEVPQTVFEFTKKSGTKAQVDVVFSRSGTSGTVAIPAGTRVKTESGLRFILNSASSIADGNTDSADSTVTAEKVGTAYNVGSTSINVIEDTIAGVEEVSNTFAATGGVDVESDLAYKNRFQAYIEGLGRTNIAGLKTAALSVEGITSVSLVEHFPPVGDVNVDVYIDDGTSTSVSDDLVDEVQSVIDGDGTEDNPGYRAAGLNVVVNKPNITTVNVGATLTLLSGIDVDQLEIDVTDAISAYINTLGVGEDVLYNEVISAIMGVYGVYNVTSVTLNAGSADVPIADTNVARLGTLILSGI